MVLNANSNGSFSGDLEFLGMPEKVMVVIVSEDGRTRYEELVASSQLKFLFYTCHSALP